MPLPSELFSRPDDTHAVCVFAASSEAVSDSFRTFAAELGTRIAEQGWRLVYGGGPVGLMGEVARAAVAAGGPVTGVIPRWLNRREIAYDGVSELIRVDTMAERKILMDVRSDAFVVLPGGIGTLDELLDVLTTRQLGRHDRPLVLAEPDRFWQPMVEMLVHMRDHGLLHDDTIGLMERTADLDRVMAAAGPAAPPTAAPAAAPTPAPTAAPTAAPSAAPGER